MKLGVSVDLAFVVSGITGFGGGDTKLPIIIRKDMVDTEPFLAGVAEGSVGQDVQVTLSDPR